MSVATMTRMHALLTQLELRSLKDMEIDGYITYDASDPYRQNNIQRIKYRRDNDRRFALPY